MVAPSEEDLKFWKGPSQRVDLNLPELIYVGGPEEGCALAVCQTL